MIQNYPDNLFTDWIDFIDKVLAYEGEFDFDSSPTGQINTIFNSKGSNWPTRAMEFYTVGFLKEPFTGSGNALKKLLEKEIILTTTGLLTYLIYKAKNQLEGPDFSKALSALCGLCLIKQYESFGENKVSLNTLFKYLLHHYPQLDTNREAHYRYLAAAMFCEIKIKPKSLLQSLLNSEKPTLRLIEYKKGEEDVLLATFNSSSDIKDAIASNVSLSSLHYVKKSLYFIGNHSAEDVQGLYYKAFSEFDDFLNEFYEYEIANLNSTDLESFYGGSQDPISFLNTLHTNSKLATGYKTMITSLKEACLKAVESLEIDSSLGRVEGSSAKSNIIFFGPPGTGKSHRVEKSTKAVPEGRKKRVTFHPSYDYTSFVGGYKPTTEKNDETGKEEIKYKFVPQTFTKIFVDAWNDPDKNDYYLIIEEINRGNSAEIFGDLFQLLDRDADYAISPSEDLKKYLATELNDEALKLLEDDIIKLPSNLHIYATMNTSDQSLYPIDSAFKRRWDWIYIPINYEEENSDGTLNLSCNYKVKLNEKEYFSWIEFLKAVNKNITNNPGLGMDKCVGNYFIKPRNSYINIDIFIHKVIFYLWNDVFKDEEDTIFDNYTYEDFFPVEEKGKEIIKELLSNLNIDLQKIEEPSEDESSD